MNLAKWTFLFLSTVGIGIVAALVIGMGMFFLNPNITPNDLGMEGIGYNVFQTAVLGALFGAFSHMVFFAYLVLNYFAQGILRSQALWSYIQVFFIVMVPVYSVVLRTPQGQSFLPYVVLPVLLILFAIPVARLKVKQTNRNSLIPTLFFLISVTLLEAVPALRLSNNEDTVYMMIASLFACNAWQIMRLHKIVVPSVPKETAHRAP